MNAFEQFLSYLEDLGLKYDTGFLIGSAATKDTIGYRLITDQQQIDLYIRDEFWDASKSHPKLAESQEISNGITVTRIVK